MPRRALHLRAVVILGLSLLWRKFRPLGCDPNFHHSIGDKGGWVQAHGVHEPDGMDDEVRVSLLLDSPFRLTMMAMLKGGGYVSERLVDVDDIVGWIRSVLIVLGPYLLPVHDTTDCGPVLRNPGARDQSG